MEKTNYIEILGNPSLIQQEHTNELKSVIDKFPYFQSARALYLKTLKNNESFKYNSELKQTAAYTTDRTILFDFITSLAFKTSPSLVEKVDKPILSEVKVEEEIVENSEISEKDEVAEVKEKLEIGKPLEFSKNEAHSFNQWLQLSAKNQVVRKPALEESSAQNSIIDRFISMNPRMPRINKNETITVKPKGNNPTNELMTETLAKVYLEQKKYDNAIKAYKILSLKYPEKSGFFADQIKQIEILQKN